MSIGSVAISDPARLCREGLQHLLAASQFSVSVVGETLTDVFAIPPCPAALDLVICRLGRDADVHAELAEMRRAKDDNPGLRFVVLSDVLDRDLLQRAIAAGADAVLSMDISPEILHRALEFVMLGQQMFPALVADAGMSQNPDLIPFPRRCIAPVAVPAPEPRDAPARLLLPVPDRGGDVSLSDREAQILQCLVNGASNKLIARDLDITEATVKVHIKGLLRKVRVNNRTQAAIWGVTNGVALERKQHPVPDLSVVEAFPRRAAQ